VAYNKPLKALASLAGTLTHGLRHFVPYFSPCVIAPYGALCSIKDDLNSEHEKDSLRFCDIGLERSACILLP